MGIVTVGNKADILAIVLVGIYKALCFGNFPRLMLGHSAEREKDSAELILRERIQNVALILCIIGRLAKNPATLFFVVFVDGVVTRYDVVKLQFLCSVHELIKLDISVAVNARVRRSAVAICVNESLDNLQFEIIGIIENIIRYTESVCNAPCVLNIVERTAGLFLFYPDILVIVKLHRYAYRFIALLSYQISSDGAVNSAAHGNHSLFHGSTLSAAALAAFAVASAFTAEYIRIKLKTVLGVIILECRLNSLTFNQYFRL